MNKHITFDEIHSIESYAQMILSFFNLDNSSNLCLSKAISRFIYKCNYNEMKITLVSKPPKCRTYTKKL